MEKENKEILSGFMKKQISQKSIKESERKSEKKIGNFKKNQKGEDQDKEELSDKEKLEEAKKESNSKAANYDNSEMLKKLIIETLLRYIVVIGGLIIFAIAIITSAPAIMDFFYGIIRNLLFSDIRQ